MKISYFSEYIMNHSKIDEIIETRRSNFKYLMERVETTSNINPKYKQLSEGVKDGYSQYYQ